MMRTKTAPTHLINLGEQIHCFELCRSDFAHHLICAAVMSKIILALVKFPEETESEIFEWVQLKEIFHDGRVHAISFSPQTSLAVLPKTVTLCAAGADFVLRIFRSDLEKTDTVQELKGHTSYLNDIAWEPEGDALASVSDDQTCRIWTSADNFEKAVIFVLKSAGMSVKWHPTEPEKILVAEKNGMLHLYNTFSEEVIASLESPHIPLMSADWSLHNSLHMTALAEGNVITWDLSRSCRPLEMKKIHEDVGRVVKMCPNADQVTASVGRPNITLKVFTAKSPVPLLEAPLILYGGISWHYRLPYIAAAQDRKLCFWKIQIK